MVVLTVTQLPPKMTKERLEELFEAYEGVVTRFDNKSVWNISAKVEVPDEKAEEALKEVNKKKIDGKELKVSGNIPPKSAAPVAPKVKEAPAAPTLDQTASPYRFATRDIHKSKKKPVEAFHDQLLSNRFDVAFEVTWRSKTPVAANPCNDGGVEPTCPSNFDGKFQGYDKRWLMIGNRLAISPFTVKSAIANGYAALSGSCYRVTSRIEKHPENPDREKFNYNGKYKRYRVVMSNSKPGILQSIDYKTGAVVIQKVTEYFYDSPTPPAGISFNPGATYFCCPTNNRHKLTITSDSLFQDRQANTTEVKYMGRYNFGMNLSFGPGQFNKKHYERFYSPSGAISGAVSPINLGSLQEQKENVYMGVFKKLDNTVRDDQRKGLDDGPWHQNLTKLKEGDWVYYQDFNGKVTAIGLNFQFKTTFEHSDAVPADQQACTDMQTLCPRCSLFGMADDSGRKDREAVGFKGRFRAGALVNDLEIIEENLQVNVPNGAGGFHNASLLALKTSAGEEIARQFLLPIMGAPKPNKRDVVGGYYEKGFIRGAKQHLHSGHTMETFKSLIERVNGFRTLRDVHGPVSADMPYSHDLRSYALVCKENIGFSGTVGGENCSAAEIAALVMLLQRNIDEQGFKIGLGKSLGLGSIASSIKKVWIRSKDHYQWEPIEFSGSKILDLLDARIPGMKNEVDALKKAQQALNEMQRREQLPKQRNRNLAFPAPGHKYWDDFQKSQL